MTREERDQLRDDVALMRELGVTRWGDIELGADPNTRIEDDQNEATIVVRSLRRPTPGLVPRGDDATE